MKTLSISLFSFLFMTLSFTAFSQEKTEKIKVSGNCGMCKKKIEKAAKEAGVSYAAWNADTKELTVTYASNSTNKAKIEKAVAGVGYDTENVKASQEAYDGLHGCCKYERTSSNEAKADCCKNGKCDDCCAGGKCSKDAACCKDGKCDKNMDCCKNGTCEHHKKA